MTEEKKIRDYRAEAYNKKIVDQLADNLIEWVEENVKTHEFFLLGDWAFSNGVNPKHLGYMGKKSEKFKTAHQLAKAWQEHRLAKGALKKEFDSRFSSFFLAVHCGWKLDPQKDKEEELLSDFRYFLNHVRGKNDEADRSFDETESGSD